MIAVDVNIIAYLLIAGEKTAEARRVRELDADWVVPDLWRDELLNILTTYVRQSGASLESARALWLSAANLFESKESVASPLTTLELAQRYRLSAYDAQYMAVATEFGVPLITEDRALVQAIPLVAITMDAYLKSAAPHPSES